MFRRDFFEKRKDLLPEHRSNFINNITSFFIPVIILK